MQTEETTITLASLTAAEEQFQEALAKVLEDLDDPNKADGNRKIELIVTIIPDRDTQLHTLKVHCKATFGARKEWAGRMVMGREKGKMVARMIQMEKQQGLPFNVAPFNRKEEAL
jgi:hypothetical protein